MLVSALVSAYAVGDASATVAAAEMDVTSNSMRIASSDYFRLCDTVGSGGGFGDPSLTSFSEALTKV